MVRERAFLGISHTPLLGLNPVDARLGAELGEALAQVRDAVQAWDPERILLIGPDHYNGFFNELMPPFCLGTQAEAVGDYGTPAGPLNVPAAQAEALADWLMDQDFDIAVSRRMKVDHGLSQPLQILWHGLQTPPVIPLFMNAVAAPGIARMRRCAQLGRALGRWLDDSPARTLVIGSGGLSHEPPVPTLDHPDPLVRERITVRYVPSDQERAARTRRVMAAGMALAGGDPSIKPLAPDWDAGWMAAIESADFEKLASTGEQAISRDAGLSAHESKTWIVARAAMPARAPMNRVVHYYRAIPEYIAGFGILMMTTPGK